MTPVPSAHKFLSVLALAGAMACAPALAHGHKGGHQARGPQASLSAQASTEVAQDTVEITLAADLAAESQAAAAEQLNARLDAAMKQAKGHEGIEARSGNYRIWPSSNQDGKISEWRGRAELILKSRDFVAASRLAGELGQHMPISGLSFSVSTEARAKAEQALLGQAVQAFQQRAQALTDALGFASYRYVTLDLGGSGEVGPMPVARMMMAKADAAVAAPIEGGTQSITVSVSGTIALRPASKAADR